MKGGNSISALHLFAVFIARRSILFIRSHRHYLYIRMLFSTSPFADGDFQWRHELIMLGLLSVSNQRLFGGTFSLFISFFSLNLETNDNKGQKYQVIIYIYVSR